MGIRNRLAELLPATFGGAPTVPPSAPPPAPALNGNGKHETKSGVDIQFAGPNTGRLYYLSDGIPGDVERVTRETAYAAALYCYVAIKYRAENLAEAPLQVVELTDDGPDPLPDHPLARLLAEPGPDYDMGEMVELTQTYLDVDSAALWIKDPNLLGETGRLTPFSEREFSVERTRDRLYGRFRVNTERGRKTYEADQVVHFRTVNPYRRDRGLSPTDVALSWLNLGTKVTAAVRHMLENAVFPSIVLTADPDWHPTDEEFEREVAKLEAFHAGPQNTGKPLWMLGGGKAERVSLTPVDVLPEALLDRIEACVAAAYGIPPVVLSFLAGLRNSPWSQMEEARRCAYEDTLLPLWTKFARRLTRQLLRQIDPDPSHVIQFDLSEVRALKKDETRRLQDAQMATTWTLDERRIWAGQEPMPEGDSRGAWIEAVDEPLFMLDNAAQDAEITDDGPDLEGEAAGGVGAAVATALNGAQITAAVTVLQAVATGEIAEVPAVELLVAVGIERERAKEMVSQQALHGVAPADAVPAPGPKPADEG